MKTNNDVIEKYSFFVTFSFLSLSISQNTHTPASPQLLSLSLFATEVIIAVQHQYLDIGIYTHTSPT